jgi:tripartite-type tricarboxylate transporter receptor subunit TctC
MKAFRKYFLGVLSSIVLASFAHAQDYPTKTITMILPSAPGGTTDVLGRMLAEKMGAALNQQIVIENVSGAGQTLGAARVAKARGDGYTLLFINMGIATQPALYRKLPFHPITDLEPVGLVIDVPYTLVSRKNFPANDFKELAAYVKNNKNTTIATVGLGSATHLCAAMMMKEMGVELSQISYRGAGPALNDLVGGHIDLLCDMTPSTMSYIKSGTLKVYGVTSKERVPSIGDVPTLNEAGLTNFEIAAWHALFAPKGTPTAITNKVSVALQKALQDPYIKQRVADLGGSTVSQDRAKPEALRAHLKAEVERWDPILKNLGVYAD